ncbi:MAG: hypothetical protein ACLQFR_24180 [Streptosporangiaceae bacterium]
MRPLGATGAGYLVPARSLPLIGLLTTLPDGLADKANFAPRADSGAP